jgi:hypothetical protein
MTLRKRLARLEGSGIGREEAGAVFFTLHGTTDDDLTAIGNGTRVVERLTGESIEDLQARAVATLTTTAVGLPLILQCHYSEEARQRCAA